MKKEKVDVMEELGLGLGMTIPVIVRLTLEDGKLFDVNLTATAEELVNGESITVTIPEGTFKDRAVVYGYQIIADPGEVLSARKFIFNPLYLAPDIAWSITATITISC